MCIYVYVYVYVYVCVYVIVLFTNLYRVDSQRVLISTNYSRQRFSYNPVSKSCSSKIYRFSLIIKCSRWLARGIVYQGDVLWELICAHNRLRGSSNNTVHKVHSAKTPTSLLGLTFLFVGLRYNNWNFSDWRSGKKIKIKIDVVKH